MSLSFKDMKTAIDIAVKANHVPNIVGLQGIGKSDLVREYARENGYAFREVTCSLVQEGDLAMPYIDKGNEVSYAVNKIVTELCEEAKNCEYAILFLDEFNRSSAQVQSELMNLVLQREIVGYKLASNVRIILAMNPNPSMSGYEDTEYSVSYSDSAMLGRVVSLDLKPTLSDWLEYGRRVENGRQKIHETVLGFLSVNKNAFVTKEVAGNINNTPRGWSRVSDIVYSYEGMGINSTVVLKNLISGTIEKVFASSFVEYYKLNSKGIDFYNLAKEVLDGDFSKVGSLNDAELDKTFNFMVELVYRLGNITDEWESNLVDFILSVSNGLTYSWVCMLEKDYPELYEGLVGNDKFSEYVLNMLVDVKNRKAGGFSGK